MPSPNPMVDNRVTPVALPLVSEKFRAGIFADFGDIVRARIAELRPSRNWRHKETVRFYEWLLDEVDADRYGAMQQAFLRAPEQQAGYLKYLDPIRWFEHKLRFAHLLGLHERKGLRILDIGTGPGHFLLVARFYGHQAIGTDLIDDKAAQDAAHFESSHQSMFKAFADVFALDRIQHRVQPLQTLSALPGGFDLVTAFSVYFDRIAGWNAKAWDFFLRSLEAQVLAERGSLFMTLIRARLTAGQWNYLAAQSRPLPEGQVWIDFPRSSVPPLPEEAPARVAASPRPNKDEVAALYRDLPYLEAYRRHTDMRVALDPQQAIGGRWEELGRLQFEYLVANGLKPGHRMLDVGCGTLRGGRRFIGYLDPGGYTGVDISSAAIESGKQLVLDEGLAGRHPTLLWNAEPEQWFGTPQGATYDVLLAQSVFTHLEAHHIEHCFLRLSAVLAPGGRFFFTYNDAETSVRRNLKGFGHPFRLFETLAAQHGFALERRSDYAHPLRQTMVVLRRA